MRDAGVASQIRNAGQALIPGFTAHGCITLGLGLGLGLGPGLAPADDTCDSGIITCTVSAHETSDLYFPGEIYFDSFTYCSDEVP